MPVNCTEEERRLTAAVTGELDHHGAKAVMEELDRRIDAALPRELTLDLGGLTFTDSSGHRRAAAGTPPDGPGERSHAGDQHAGAGGKGVPGRRSPAYHPI